MGKKRTLYGIVAVLVLLAASSGGALAEGELVWAKCATGGGDYDWDVGWGVAGLSDGSSLVTGTFGGSVTFGAGEPNETTLISAGEGDMFVAKYNADGTLAWAKRAGGTDQDEGLEVAGLSDGRAVVVGVFGELGIPPSYTSTFGAGEPNETVLTGQGEGDIFLAKYNPDGTLAWAKSATGPGSNWGLEIAALSDDSTLVTGMFSGSLGPDTTVTFGAGEPNETTLTPIGPTPSMFLAKYNPDGTFAWAKRAGAWHGHLAALPDGSALVSGEPHPDGIFGPGEPNETTLIYEAGCPLFLAKYNRDGTLAWAIRTAGDEVRELAALPDGSAFVTGHFNGTMTFGAGEPNETTFAVGPADDIFVAKYNPDGTLAWAKRAGATDTDRGHAILSLSDGGSLVSGYFCVTATFGPGEPNETTLTSVGGWDFFLAKYNENGTLAWAKQAGSVGFDPGNEIAGFPDGTAVVTGRYGGEITFGAGDPNETTLPHEALDDIFVVKYLAVEDADNDGLAYWDEVDTHYTDPANPDTDRDGLRDGDEVRDLDPVTPDVQNPFDPLDPDSTGDDFQPGPDGVLDGWNDYDGDGMSNRDEFTFGYDPMDPNSWAEVPLGPMVGVSALVLLLLAARRRIAPRPTH